MNSNSNKNTITVANRISDNNTGKVSLVSNDQTFSTKDDIEWNNEEKLKGNSEEKVKGRDLSKRSLEHHGRESLNDGHVFAYSSSIISDYANWEVVDYLGIFITIS